MDNNSGTSVRMNSSAVLSICDKMSDVLKNMNEEVQQIYELRNRIDSNWQGNASHLFYEQFDKVNKELQDGKIKGMYELLVNAVTLIDENRKLSSELSEKDFEYITKVEEILSQNPTITGVEVGTINKPVDSTITSNIDANNTIGSVEVSLEAIPSSSDVTSEVSIDTKIDSNTVDFEELPKSTDENIEQVTNDTNTAQINESVDNGSDNTASLIGAAGLGDIFKGGV
ncbi:MAG: hypothetical protein IKF36_04420 [Bacilli bacterium]|nr:hypothetical protein [Bacilli bacterium]